MRRMKLVYTFMAAVASKKHPLYTDRFSSIQQLLYDVLDFYVCFIPFLLFSHSFLFPPSSPPLFLARYRQHP